MPDKAPGSPQLQRHLIVLENFKADLMRREHETFLFAAMLLRQVSGRYFHPYTPLHTQPSAGFPFSGLLRHSEQQVHREQIWGSQTSAGLWQGKPREKLSLQKEMSSLEFFHFKLCFAQATILDL